MNTVNRGSSRQLNKIIAQTHLTSRVTNLWIWMSKLLVITTFAHHQNSTTTHDHKSACRSWVNNVNQLSMLRSKPSSWISHFLNILRGVPAKITLCLLSAREKSPFPSVSSGIRCGIEHHFYSTRWEIPPNPLLELWHRGSLESGPETCPHHHHYCPRLEGEKVPFKFSLSLKC